MTGELQKIIPKTMAMNTVVPKFMSIIASLYWSLETVRKVLYINGIKSTDNNITNNRVQLLLLFTYSYVY